MYEQEPNQAELAAAERRAAVWHWRDLCLGSVATEALLPEFWNSYLGCWPNRQAFGEAFVSELAAVPPANTERLAQAVLGQLERTGELAMIADDFGVHVFVHPAGPTAQGRAPQPDPHPQLRAVPDRATAIAAHPAGSSHKPSDR
jgi:hypothetical protein